MAAVTMHHFSGLAAPFVRSKGTISGGVFSRQREREIELARIRLEQAEDEIDGIIKELDDYRAETIKVIRGESPLNAQLLNSLMSEAADRLRAAQAREEEAQASLDGLISTQAKKRAPRSFCVRGARW